MARKYPNTEVLGAGIAELNDAPRKVSVGHRGFGGKEAQVYWELFGVLSDFVNPKQPLPQGKRYPNIARHWCVIVGDYYHHLQSTTFGITEDAWIWYGNNKVDPQGDNWDLYDVGETRFNDFAIQTAGEQTILAMPEKYDIFDNNCQNFVSKLLKLICRDDRQIVLPSLANLEIAFVPTADGKVDDAAKSKDEKVEVALVAQPEKMAELLAHVQDIMNKNTPLTTVVKEGQTAKMVEVK